MNFQTDSETVSAPCSSLHPELINSSGECPNRAEGRRARFQVYVSF